MPTSSVLAETIVLKRLRKDAFSPRLFNAEGQRLDGKTDSEPCRGDRSILKKTATNSSRAVSLQTY
jgi:hypothetical protein